MKSAEAAAVAFSPRMARHGSWVTIRDRKKTRNTSPRRTGKVSSRRRRMKRVTFGTSLRSVEMVDGRWPTWAGAWLMMNERGADCAAPRYVRSVLAEREGLRRGRRRVQEFTEK